MDFLTGNNDLGTLGLGLLIAGAAAGLFTGMLGAGGGLILIPVLYHVLGALGVSEAVRLHLAAGTALLCLLPTTLASLSGQVKAKAIDLELLKRWAIPLGLGAIGGVGLALVLSIDLLAMIFGATAILVALWMALAKDSWRIAAKPPGALGGVILPFGFGALASLMGISGASLFSPLLQLSGLPRQRALGTATGLATIVCAVAALAYAVSGWTLLGLPKYSYGFVNLMAFGIAAPVMYATSTISARYAGAVEAKRPRATFALFVLISVGKMLWDVLG